MRRLSRSLARSVVAVTVVTILSVPIAEARTRDDDGPWFLSRSRIIKVLKTWGLSVVCGDEMSEPKP